jgi:tetratricopeptide (TPR) repeat protein
VLSRAQGSGPPGPVRDARPHLARDLAPAARNLRSVLIVAAALFVAALGLRLFNVGTALETPRFGHGVQTFDARYYDLLARRMAAGEWLGSEVYYLAPLYPYALGAAYRVLGEPAGENDWSSPVESVLYLQALLGASNVVLIFLLGLRYGGLLVGSIAGGAACVYGYFIFCDLTLMPSSLVLFVHLLAMLLLVEAGRRDRLVPWLATGLACSACVLAHGSGWFFALVALCWSALAAGGPLGRRITAVACLIAGLGVPVAAVTARNWAVGRDLVLVTSNAGTNLYIGNNAEADGAFRPHPFRIPGASLDHYARGVPRGPGDPAPSEVSRFMRDRAMDFIVENPLDALTLVARKVRLFFNRYEIGTNDHYYFARGELPLYRLPLLGFGLIAPLGLAGLLLALYRRWETGLLSLALASQVAGYAVFFVLGRYRLVAVACLMVFAGQLVAWTSRSILRGRREGLLLLAVVVAGLLLLVNLPVDGFEENRGAGQQHVYRARGLVLEGRLDEAEKEFELALAADFTPWRHPDRWRAEALLDLGRIAAVRGDWDGARRHLVSGLRLADRLAEHPAGPGLRARLEAALAAVESRRIPESRVFEGDADGNGL